jgi:hypothetical protein
MNLDLIRKEADTMGLTSRADGCRNPILDVILDELTYNISYLSPFLLVTANHSIYLSLSYPKYLQFFVIVIE